MAGSSSNAATKAFFKSGYGIVLAVYDTRRGQQEGREAEKILAFYPRTAPNVMQSSIVGLAQALTMFAGTFNKECPFHSMEAHKHLWTMYHAEPDLWLLLVVGRHFVGPDCLPSSLTGLLKGLHSLAALLHGLLSTQLDQDPSGGRVRLRLQPLLQDVAASLLQPDSPALFSLSSPLGLTGGVPLLPVSNAAFTRLQSLTNSLLVARLFGCRPVVGVLVAWQTCLLWSSLSSGDTAALHSLAVRGLEPAAREGAKHKTWRRPVLSSPQQQQQQQSSQPASGAASPQLPQSTPPSSVSSSSGSGGSNAPAAVVVSNSRGGSSGLQAEFICLANAVAWCCRADGMLLPVWAAGADAAVMGSTAGGTAAGQQQQQQQQFSEAAGCAELPMVWLQSGSEPARLMAWHSGPLLVLLLLEPQGPAAASTAAVTASLAGMLAAPAAALVAQLSAELPAKHLWHVKGLRYLYQDHLAGAVRASPRRKVFTLSAASLRVAADTRQCATLEATAAADPTAVPLGGAAAAAAAAAAADGGEAGAVSVSSSASGSSGGAQAASQAAWESFAAGGEDADVEVVVKGSNEAWVVARHTAAGRQLTAVVDSDKEGLAGVMRKVQGFCDVQCPGVFEGLS